MTTLPTRLTPPERGNFPKIEGCALRVYTPHQGLLSRSAWEALGSPEAIAIEVNAGGYSIVATTLHDPSAIRVYRHRKVSIGVIAGALKDSEFPLRISLEPERYVVYESGKPDVMLARLRFGNVA